MRLKVAPPLGSPPRACYASYCVTCSRQIEAFLRSVVLSVPSCTWQQSVVGAFALISPTRSRGNGGKAFGNVSDCFGQRIIWYIQKYSLGIFDACSARLLGLGGRVKGRYFVSACCCQLSVRYLCKCPYILGRGTVRFLRVSDYFCGITDPELSCSARCTRTMLHTGADGLDLSSIKVCLLHHPA